MGAAAVAYIWREIDANGLPTGVVVTDEMTIDFRSPIVWTDASERGKKVLALVKTYQEASKDKIGEKVQGLTTHLEDNEKKDGVMVVCVGNDKPGETPLPSLKAAMELPDDELYLQEEGASPWVSSSKPWTYRIGPGMLPLPGWQLVQARGAVGVALLLLPVQKLVEEGIVFLNEVRAILNKPEGGKWVATHGMMMVLPTESCIGWMPYGWMTLMIAPDEKIASHCWILPVFSGHLACDVPVSAWTPIAKLSIDLLTKHSGQPVWKARLETTKKLVDARLTTSTLF